MQLESLKLFCDVARLHSFSKAAAAHGRTQSAASQVVLQLEERLGVQLIDRSKRPLQLTALGKTYYEGCKRLVDEFVELEASIVHARTQLAPTVEVAAIYSVGLSDMGQYVEHFARVQPGGRVHLEYLHPDRVYEKVLEGTADLGLVSFPRKSRELIALPWREEEMVVACPPGHRFAVQQVVRVEELEGEKYVGFDRELTIRREVDRFLREQGVAVDVVLEFDNIENIKKAVEVGAGVALLPEPSLRREVTAGTLAARLLTDCQFVRPVGIIHRRNQGVSAAARRFIDLLGANGVNNGHAAAEGPDVSPRGQKTPTHGNGNGRNGTSRASRRKK
jgi:DNA-binding transcriptional LysR family regulator